MNNKDYEGDLNIYNIGVYIFISLFLISLPFTLSRIDLDLIFILIFVGGLSNTVGIADISRASFEDYNNRFTRPLLVGQLFILSSVLGADVWFLLRNVATFDSIRLWLSICVVVLAFGFVAFKKPTRVTFGVVFFIFLVVVSLHVFPDILELAKPKISNFNQKYFGQNNYIFIRPRLLSYLHLLFIPIVYFSSDFFNRNTITKAKYSLKLDIILFIAGAITVSLGIVAKNQIVEAIGIAVIFSISNAYYAFKLI